MPFKYTFHAFFHIFWDVCSFPFCWLLWLLLFSFLSSTFCTFLSRKTVNKRSLFKFFAQKLCVHAWVSERTNVYVVSCLWRPFLAFKSIWSYFRAWDILVGFYIGCWIVYGCDCNFEYGACWAFIEIMNGWNDE